MVRRVKTLSKVPTFEPPCIVDTGSGSSGKSSTIDLVAGCSLVPRASTSAPGCPSARRHSCERRDRNKSSRRSNGVARLIRQRRPRGETHNRDPQEVGPEIGAD
eukprot:6209756-Pleurochrysis_carterae.AAC.2